MRRRRTIQRGPAVQLEIAVVTAKIEHGAEADTITPAIATLRATQTAQARAGTQTIVSSPAGATSPA